MSIAIVNLPDCLQVEQEEEYLVNNLQRRLAKVCTACAAFALSHKHTLIHVCMQVNEEKAALESRLSSEQEYLDNQLQKKVCC